MEKNRNVQRKKIRKKGGPKLRFKFGGIITIFILSTAVCFTIYMMNANMNDDFLAEEFGTSAVTPSEEAAGEAKEDKTLQTESAARTELSNPVPQSPAADSTYFNDCCLITDKTLIGMKGCGFKENCVFGTDDMTLSTVTSVKIDSSFGTLSPYEIVKQKKPDIIYLMFGAELGAASADTLAEQYLSFINSLKSTLPDTEIYVMQYPPVLYDTDTLTNEIVNNYNNKLVEICNNLGIYCIDTNTALKSETGKLDESYWSYETLSLSDAGYNKVAEYILTHVVQ